MRGRAPNGFRGLKYCLPTKRVSGRATVITCAVIRGPKNGTTGRLMQNLPQQDFTRRTLLAATLGAGLGTAACSRSLAKRYFGWLMVASGAEKAVSVADLSEFRRTTAIPLGERPA